MHTVSFPGIGLNFEISRVAFQLFGVDIYYYAICIVTGIIIALCLCKWSKDNYYVRFDDVLEIILFAIIFGIFGARAYYVIFNLNYYLSNSSEILNLRDGGLAIFGGLITGGIVVIKFCKKNKINALDFLDYIVPFVALAQSIGRWGNFFNIEAYGYETTFFLRMRILDNYGVVKDVHPVFLYESIANIIIFMILRNLQSKRKFKGQILYSYMFFYTGIRAFLESFRVDSLMFLGVRISQVLSIFVFLCTGYILFKKIIKDRKKEF